MTYFVAKDVRSSHWGRQSGGFWKHLYDQNVFKLLCTIYFCPMRLTHRMNWSSVSTVSTNLQSTGFMPLDITWLTKPFYRDTSLQHLPGGGIKTHWRRVKHICVGNLTIIGWDNGLSPGRHQAIISTNDGILSIGPLGTNFIEILFETHISSFKKMDFKMSSGQLRLFCLGLNVLNSKEGWG